jgi:hypothetical protein
MTTPSVALAAKDGMGTPVNAMPVVDDASDGIHVAAKPKNAASDRIDGSITGMEIVVVICFWRQMQQWGCH